MSNLYVTKYILKNVREVSKDKDIHYYILNDSFLCIKLFKKILNTFNKTNIKEFSIYEKDKVTFITYNETGIITIYNHGDLDERFN